MKPEIKKVNKDKFGKFLDNNSYILSKADQWWFDKTEDGRIIFASVFKPENIGFEVTGPIPEQNTEKSCAQCKYSSVSLYDEPCKTCNNYLHFEVIEFTNDYSNFEEAERSCSKCLYLTLSADQEPCSVCIDHCYFKSKTSKPSPEPPYPCCICACHGSTVCHACVQFDCFYPKKKEAKE